jgi:hypothetical protein
MSTPTKQLLYSSVRIETKSLDGSTGCGTSFVFRDQTSPPGQDLFLVSNKHVVEGTDTCHIFFTSQGQDGQPKLGEPFFVRSDMFSAQWHGHPTASVDVAVMPLSWQLDLIAKDGQIPFLRPISLGDIADPSILGNIDVAAPILFVGFPNGMFDEQHYLPIVRRGHIATSADLDFNGEPVFLIDASVFPGSSGSPVFTVGDSLIGGTPSLKLLGLISAVYTQSTDGHIYWMPAPVTQIPVPVIDQMIDLGVVFKARCICEAIASFWEQR